MKSHGSIPHTRPFIVTKEDDRSSPECFAPFVNLVRQAAMGTVLCFVGFSGSDPNFLAWTGWVRDQLGPYQPRILLAGMNDCSEIQRLLIERRGMRIVDIGRLPGLDAFSRAQRHEAALLGRVVGRLPTPEVRAIASEAMKTFDRMGAGHSWMRDGLVGMFDRVVDALPVDGQLSLLVGFPAMPLQSDGPARRSRPEPWSRLRHLPRRPSRVSLGAEFATAVGRWLRAAADDDAPGSSALRRLAILERLDLLERPEAEVLSSRV